MLAYNLKEQDTPQSLRQPSSLFFASSQKKPSKRLFQPYISLFSPSSQIYNPNFNSFKLIADSHRALSLL
jgi:hypothetical protein